MECLSRGLERGMKLARLELYRIECRQNRKKGPVRSLQARQA